VIAVINFAVLVLSTILFTYFYLASVRIGVLEAKIGDRAYKLSTVNRLISVFLMTLAGVNYVIYFFNPLPIPSLNKFPWPYWISAVIGGVLAIPSLYLWFKGMIDAGKPTIIVSKGLKLYGGIYKRIRHPQASGELVFWWVLALFLNSPFLALYSIVWIPIFIWVSIAEERDLLIRYGDAYRNYRNSTGFFLPCFRQVDVANSK